MLSGKVIYFIHGSVMELKEILFHGIWCRSFQEESKLESNGLSDFFTSFEYFDFVIILQNCFFTNIQCNFSFTVCSALLNEHNKH